MSFKIPSITTRQPYNHYKRTDTTIKGLNFLIASRAILVQILTLYKASPTMGQGSELNLKELILSQDKIGQLWGHNRWTSVMDGQDSPSLIPRTRRVQTKGSHKKLRKECYVGIILGGKTVTLRKHMDFLAATPTQWRKWGSTTLRNLRKFNRLEAQSPYKYAHHTIRTPKTRMKKMMSSRGIKDKSVGHSSRTTNVRMSRTMGDVFNLTQFRKPRSTGGFNLNSLNQLKWCRTYWRK